MFVKLNNISGWKCIMYEGERIIHDQAVKYTYGLSPQENCYNIPICKISCKGTGVLEKDTYTLPTTTNMPRDWLWGIILIKLGEALHNTDDFYKKDYKIFIPVLVPENCIETDIREILPSNIIQFPNNKKNRYAVSDINFSDNIYFVDRKVKYLRGSSSTNDYVNLTDINHSCKNFMGVNIISLNNNCSAFLGKCLVNEDIRLSNSYRHLENDYCFKLKELGEIVLESFLDKIEGYLDNV